MLWYANGMSLKVCILASGSRGNCAYIASETTAILVDAGISRKKILQRMEDIGESVDALQGICVSHEHSDHIGGLSVLTRHHDIPLYANRGTVEATLRDKKMADTKWNIFTNGCEFEIGDLTIEAFSVPHDAFDPVGYNITCGDVRIGVVTDIGVPTTLTRERLKNCNAVIIESNHDENLLKDSSRPWSLKQRILGRQGHLSNEQTADVLRDIAHPGLEHVFLAHLSEDCNSEELAVKTTKAALAEKGGEHVEVTLGYPDKVSVTWQFQGGGGGSSVESVSITESVELPEATSSSLPKPMELF